MANVRFAALAAMLGGLMLWAPAGSPSPAMFHGPIAVWSQRQSSNWSGYNQGSLEQGHELFTSVSGTWVVPTASQHTKGFSCPPFRAQERRKVVKGVRDFQIAAFAGSVQGGD